ncbi:MAG: polysaccharide deacetylase, partial [Rubrivivax sp.]
MKKMIVAALGLLVSVAATAAPFKWPGGAQAAVSLGYD